MNVHLLPFCRTPGGGVCRSEYTKCGLWYLDLEGMLITSVPENVTCDDCKQNKEFVARDVVDHPPHYNQHPSGVECITITEHMNFNVGNAIKYLWRAGLKNASAIEDLKKARWYVEREIARQEKMNGGTR